MDKFFYIFIWGIFDIKYANANSNTGTSNSTTSNNSETFADIHALRNVTEFGINVTDSVQGTSTENWSTDSTTVINEQTGVTEVATNGSSTNTTTNIPSVTTPPPLPLFSSLPSPVTDVSSVCPCNLQNGQCDVNCCCDPDCGGEIALFNQCLVEKVVGNPQLCSQDAILYSLSQTTEGLAKLQTSVNQEFNPDVLCIESANYKAGLSYALPKVPTERNFEGLFRSFVQFFFGSDTDTVAGVELQATPGYLYGDVIQTVDATGEGGFFPLPAPSGTAHCSDTNPAAFLWKQATRCVRPLVLARDCPTLRSLKLSAYAGFLVRSGKNEDPATVGVEVETVVLQSLDGTQTLLDPVGDHGYDPALLDPEVCTNVVLQVRYMVTYSEVGRIENVTASFIIGAINSSMVPIQQEFQIDFVQQTTDAAPSPYSGNPGYIVGLPLVAGSRMADGIVQSADWTEGITLLHSSTEQDCLTGPHPRAPVLFGVNTVSGCTLRLTEVASCSVVSETLLGVLRGHDPPQYVASFGNSRRQNPVDWLPIRNQTLPAGSFSCTLPVSLTLEVRWTKYGSLLNPQAQIVSVTEVIHVSSLSSLSGGSGVLAVTASVTFIDVSAAARPGYKAPPTLDAKLPYDFFFPFV